MIKRKNINIEKLPVSLNVKDISNILGICKANAYELCHSKDFPSMVIGKRIVIPKVAFIKWMEDPETFK